jgi:hypothetical protein
MLRVLRPARLIVLAAAAAIASTASAAGAQSPKPTSADSVFARARQLVANGNGAAGRVLVDSMITVATPDTPVYAEALYWRARLAATGADAERDYRMIVVEYPLSPRAGDALLQLAQLESSRGDRASAATHLERFLMENPRHPERAPVGFQLVKLAFELNDFQRGCITLGRTLREIPNTEIELRNQLDYYTPRCAGVDTTRGPHADSTATKRDTTSSDSAARKPAAKGRFTLQICACATRAEADRLVKRLKTKGLDARVVGTSKPFRVRVGRYETRTAATAALNKLKAQKIEAFVTEIGGDER